MRKKKINKIIISLKIILVIYNNKLVLINLIIKFQKLSLVIYAFIMQKDV
jgi:hypothetical protein